MKICSKEINRCVTIDDSNCYKYSSKPITGSEKYFIAAKDSQGRILRQEISQADFKNSECRLVDIV